MRAEEEACFALSVEDAEPFMTLEFVFLRPGRGSMHGRVSARLMAAARDIWAGMSGSGLVSVAHVLAASVS